MSAYTLEHASRIGEGGLHAPPGSVEDAEINRILRGYKRAIASNYRAINPDSIDYFIQPGPHLVSPKIDGELWFLIAEDGDVVLANPKGRLLAGDLPFLQEARDTVGKRAVGRTVLAGELWAAPRTGRARVGDVRSAIGGEVRRLAFSPFDLCLGGDDQTQWPQELYDDKLAVLQRLTEGGKRCRAIRTETASGPADVAKMYEEWVASGKTEGLVVRPKDGRIFKVKPSIHIDAAIVGFTGRAEDPEQIRSLLLALMREDGQFQILGSLGNMGDEDNRRALMARLAPLATASNYRHASNDGALYRFVRPEVVVEFKVSDIQSDDTSGDNIQRMVLGYGADAGWAAVRKMPGVSIIHPVMVQLREDKSVNPTDVRIAQVLESVVVEDVETAVERVEMPKSSLIGREVYAKETKGALAVRKLVAWRTNKDAIDPSYPAYVVHYTDYSPGRKDPLQRVVRVATSLDDVREIWDDLKASKKVDARGWSEAEERRMPLP